MGLQNAQGMFIATGFYWDQDAQTAMAKMTSTEVSDALVRKGSIRDDGRPGS